MAQNLGPHGSDNTSVNVSLDTSVDLKHVVTQNRLVGLWRLMAGFRLAYMGAAISLAVGALARTGTYMLVRYVIDQVIGQGTGSDRLYLSAMGFVALAGIEGLSSYLRGTWAARTAEGVTLRLRNYLLDHIQRLSFTYHDHVKTGDLIERATSDVEAINRFYGDQAINLARILVMFVVNLAMLLQMNRQLALLSIAVMPVVIVMSYFFFGRVSKAYERYQEQEAILSTRLQENLTGVRVVKAFARQQYEVEKFETENWEKYRRGKRLLVMHSTFWPVSDVLCAAQTLLVMAVGALMAMDGRITIGTYVAINGMVINIIWPLRNLGRLIVQISTGLVSYRRVADIIAQEREDVETGSVHLDHPVQGDIAFDAVSFAYSPAKDLPESQHKKNGHDGWLGRVLKRKRRSSVEAEAAAALPAAAHEPAQVLHDISFHCEPGQAIALLGSTGSGKTSIVNLLLRFYDYDAGSIRLDGVDICEYPIARLRRQIGIVEQEPFLFSRTIRENIAYGAGHPVTDEQVESAAKAAAIHDIVMTFPKGYDTIVGEKGVTLSGGQRQRVAIARTLLRNPRILILDDATSSVDTETEAQIRDALAYLMRGRTTFIIAHRVQSVMNADLILVLDKGRVIQRGTHAQLIREQGVYRQIYDLQARIEEEVEKEVAGV